MTALVSDTRSAPFHRGPTRTYDEYDSVGVVPGVPRPVGVGGACGVVYEFQESTSAVAVVSNPD